MARVNEVGGHIKLTMTGVDISTATTKNIVMARPNGTRKACEASFDTNGSDGALIYHFIAGDLSCSGSYKFQMYVVLGDGTAYYSSIHTETVDDNI